MFCEKPYPSLPIVEFDLITQSDPIFTFPVMTTLFKITLFLPILTSLSKNELAPILTFLPIFFLFLMIADLSIKFFDFNTKNLFNIF